VCLLLRMPEGRGGGGGGGSNRSTATGGHTTR
jgi:hypothetical protein